MRFLRLLLLPVLASAFAPRAPLATRSLTLKTTWTDVNDVEETVTEKTQRILKETDKLVLSRVMRVVNHVPALYTLRNLLSAVGSQRWGLDIAPAALKITSPAALSVPTWVGYTLNLICISQLASVARSALADDDELSQADISHLTASNFCLTRALMNGSVANWAIAAVVSGYSARNGGLGGTDMTIHNASLELTSSITTIATILGASAALPNLIPALSGVPEVTAGLGLLAYHTLVNRKNNTKVKKVVSAGVIAGIFWNQIARGALALNLNNLLQVGTLVTAGTAYVAYVAIDKAREALAKDL